MTVAAMQIVYMKGVTIVAGVDASHGARTCRSSTRRVSRQPDQTSLMLRIRDLAATRTRYGISGFIDHGINSEQVVRALMRIAWTRGAPKTIRVENGPEFVSKTLDR